LALAAALIPPLARGADFAAGADAGFPARNFAQRALADAEILALADALMVNFFPGAGRAGETKGEPNNWFSSFSKV